MRFKGLLGKILLLTSHVIALGILIWAIFPLAKFYFSGFSAFGDWFVGYTFADYIKNHFALPPASWIYSLKTGAPFFTFYQWFHFYPMLSLTYLFGTGWGMEIYSFASLMLFYLFSYLLFWQLSKNPIFSALLTLTLYYSLGVSEALMRGGFIAQNASQFFLPLILWLILLFYQKKNRRLLVLAATLAGLTLLGHVGISLFLIFIPTLLALLCWWDEETKLFSWQKIKDTFAYGLISFLVAFPAITVGILWQASGGGKAVCETPTCVASIEGLRPYFNPWSLVVMGAMIGITSLWAILTRRNSFKKVLPFLALLGFIFAYLALTHFKLGITDTLSTFLWPLRTVWVISLGMGVVAAALLGEIKGKGKLANFALGIQVFLSLVSLGLALWMIIAKPDDLLPLFEKNRIGYEGDGPHIVRLTVNKYQVGPYKDYNRSMVLPEWLPAEETNFRIDQLWHGDFGIWPLIAKVPDIRAYAGNTNPRFDHWRSWLTSAETDQLGEKENRGKQRQSNINQSLFMIDWYAIRYLNTSIDFVVKLIQRDFPYAPYMESDWLTDRHETRTIRHEGKEGASYRFDFWRIREEFTSPIIKATNVPTVLFVGDEEGWVNFVRSLGMSNTNSQELIPIKGPQILEDLKLNELKNFDSVVLYAYNYDDFNKAWDDLEQYVNQGGTLFIDTGREVKESENATLLSGMVEMPKILPSGVLRREAVGTKWNLQISESPITAGIDFNRFSPLMFGNQPWKLSFIPEDKNLRENTRVILRQSGRPVLVTRRIGAGKVIWSGLNLPYYVLNYQAVEEAKLLRQIITWGTGGLGEAKPEYTAERPQPEKVEVSGNDFKGVVFKENFDPGWKAKVNGGGVKIYPAGPDVMYIPIPKSIKKPIKVDIKYRGTLLNWFLFIVSSISLVAALKYVVTGNLIKIGGESLKKIKTTRKLKSWWEGEEE